MIIHGQSTFANAGHEKNQMPEATEARSSIRNEPRRSHVADKVLMSVFAVLLSAPLLAHGEVYKCKQADGSVSYQEQACQAGAVSTPLALPKATDAPGTRSDVTGNARKASGRSDREPKQRGQVADQSYEQKRANEEIRAHNEEVSAYNKRVRCNRARQQLDVVKSQKPIFSNDNAGSRNYVEDKDRGRVTAAAERQVREECL
jgi:hypothetical protein